MRMSYGYLVISPEAQKLIEEGRARLEKANVVWNPGSGHTGVFEWGKFVEVDEDELKNNDVKLIVSGIAAGAIATAGIAGVIVYTAKRKQDERDKKVNNLISCLSSYTLELCDNNVRQSTVLDLKVTIREFMSDKKLLKKVDETLLKRSCSRTTLFRLDFLNNKKDHNETIYRVKKGHRESGPFSIKSKLFCI